MRIGVDLGGTKIEAVALDGSAVLARRRVATPAASAALIVRAVGDLVRGLEAELARKGSVGVGTPGALSPATGLLRNSNTTCLNGTPLDRLLADELGREVRIANDANCFALSEAVDGAGAGARVVFGVILGTGTGGGVVVDGQVLAGKNAVAGEWGHNPLPWPTAADGAPRCYCGKAGCIETHLSGPALARDHTRHSGQELAPAAIAAAAAAGDRHAVATLERYVDRLGRSLATVINLLDPDTIVLGGGVSRIGWLYGALPAVLARRVFSDALATTVVPARHGDASGVRGAAWLWGGPDGAGMSAD
jgi:fructokinase